MQIITWNVNGIRALVKKGFLDWLLEAKPDILALQETKIDAASLDPIIQEPYDYLGYWSSAQKKGYSGTALLTKHAPINVWNGIGEEEFDNEGRFTIAEFSHFFVLSCYFPNSQQERKRLDYKLRYCKAIETFAEKCLEKGKDIIITGDFNIAPCPIDLARPKENEESAGYYLEEREWMNRFLSNGYVDTFRDAHPDKVQYTWWSYRTQARVRNIGWRIDHIVVNAKLKPRVKQVKIFNNVMGSDHCPYGVEFDLTP